MLVDFTASPPKVLRSTSGSFLKEVWLKTDKWSKKITPLTKIDFKIDIVF